ncbi:hypothetical protein OM428_09470 [Enterococcus gallinarum]|nr:hypothetical protein [Enterococcus gallinarum]
MKKSLITMGIVILSSIILPITAVAAEYTSNGAIILKRIMISLNQSTLPIRKTSRPGRSHGSNGTKSRNGWAVVN